MNIYLKYCKQYKYLLKESILLLFIFNKNIVKIYIVNTSNIYFVDYKLV